MKRRILIAAGLVALCLFALRPAPEFHRSLCRGEASRAEDPCVRLTAECREKIRSMNPIASLRSPRPRVVEFAAVPSLRDLRRLEEMGTFLLQPKGGSRALYHVPDEALSDVQSLPFVGEVLEVRTEDKIAWEVQRQWEAKPWGVGQVAVAFHDEVDLESALRTLRESGLEPVEEGFGEGHWIVARGWKDGILRAAADGRVYQVWTEPTPWEAANDDAARLARVNEIRPGGVSGYALSGQGVTLAMWDGGQVRDTHIEFGGRVTNREQASLNDHATHVAGIMIAAGIDPQARGMAPDADLLAFTSGNAFEEISTYRSQFTAGNLSWGKTTGWDLNNVGDWVWWGPENSDADSRFGKYTLICREADRSASGDDIVMVKSAGNDRNDTGPGRGNPHFHGNDTTVFTDFHHGDDDNGGFDSLPEFAPVKNMLVVGALTDAGTATTGFSSWGPTDDGRIKPDVVSNGDSLWSTVSANNAAYDFMSGTSMAAPTVTGICGLLKQMANERGLTEWHMPASFLRALLIHTAVDLGRIGPDATFGWGRVDARAAADIIHKVDQEAPWTTFAWGWLDPNQTQVYRARHRGGVPFRITLVWADPAGDANTGGNNDRTPALVHDLELRVIDPNGRVHFPWRLDPVRPDRDAVRGENHVDSVERVDIEAPETVEGEYRIEVSHTGILTGSERFSIVAESITGGGALPFDPPETPKDLYPNGDTVYSPFVTLHWANQMRTEEYEVVVRVGVKYLTYRTKTHELPIRLPRKGLYRWSVRALNFAGASDWAEASFTWR